LHNILPMLIQRMQHSYVKYLMGWWWGLFKCRSNSFRHL